MWEDRKGKGRGKGWGAVTLLLWMERHQIEMRYMIEIEMRYMIEIEMRDMPLGHQEGMGNFDINRHRYRYVHTGTIQV